MCGSGEKIMFHRKNEYILLNKMLEDAIAGDFEESIFDESELSKLQTKMLYFLSTSSMSRRKLDEERNNLKELITNISHQTKTPLTNILLYAGLLEELKIDETATEYVKEISSQAKKLEQLIASFVKMSRLETGVFQYHGKEVSLDKFAHRIADSGKAKAKEKNISIVVVPEENASARFDPKWTEEAITNILDNAIKYSPVGSQITISTFQYEMFSGIKVVDEGIGIEEYDIPKIFQRFYRGESVTEQEGIGVGLFVAREIIEAQGGYIKVTSKVKKGSTFAVYLPRQ